MGTTVPPTLTHRVLSVAYASSITLDCSLADTFDVTLTGSPTIAFSHLTDGQRVIVRLKQGGSGSYTVTWDAAVDWGDAGAPTLSTAVGAVDECGGCYYGSSSKLHMYPAATGYA